MIRLTVRCRPDQAEAVLEGNGGLEAIKETERQARQFWVDGVPFFVINGRITLSGAQPVDVFLEAFKNVAAVET